MLTFVLLFLSTCLPFLAGLTFAAPIEEQSQGLVKLALRKVPVVRRDEEPLLAFQRHHNSAIKRLHHFTRTPPPDQSFFRERFFKRQLSLETRRDKTDVKLAGGERLWLPPVSTKGTLEAVLDSATVQATKPAQAPTTVAQVAAAGAPTTTIGASGTNANGFSNAGLKALQDDSVTKSTSALVSGGLDYEIEANDAGYIAEVQFGTPAKTFLMLMDSGSGDTWVPSSSCAVSVCGNHQTLGAVSSSTFNLLSIAGMNLPNHVFGVTTKETAQFSGATIPFDGLMGLSFNSLSQQGTATPIDSLASTGKTTGAIMGYALGRIADGVNDGEIVFGSADTSKFDASTTQTLPASSPNGFWQAAMGAVTVNGKVVASERQAVLDSGTTLMIAPGDDATLFHAQIAGSASDGQGGFTIPCTTTANVAMTFGNAAFTIDARDLIFQPVNPRNPQGQCISSLSQGTLIDNVTWLLGDTFLKNVYMATNVQARTIQLSARTDSLGSSSANKASSISTGGSSQTTGSSSNQAVVASSGESLIETLQNGAPVWLLAGVVALLAGKMI